MAANSDEQVDPTLVELLRQGDFFARLDTQAIEDCLRASELITALAGQPIWSPEEPKDAAFILVSGRLKLSFRVQPDGQREAQYTQSGTLLSLSSLVHPWPHASACVALERSRVLKLGARDFQRLFEAERPIAFALIDAIADDLVEEMQDANRRLHEVFGHPAETLRMLRRRNPRGSAGE